MIRVNKLTDNGRIMSIERIPKVGCAASMRGRYLETSSSRHWVRCSSRLVSQSSSRPRLACRCKEVYAKYFREDIRKAMTEGVLKIDAKSALEVLIPVKREG